MNKTRFTETQIVKAMKEHEGGRRADNISRELWISKATLHNWKAKYGGMESSDVKHLKDLEEENPHLKKMYADLAMDNRVLKDLFTKKAGLCRKKTIKRRYCPRGRCCSEQGL